MSLEIEKKTVKTILTVMPTGTRAINDADIIVPDYQPDVAKVLQAEVFPMVCEKSVQNGFITLNGNIDYSILYLSDEKDAPPSVKPISTRMPFSHRIEAPDTADGSEVHIFPDVIRVEFSPVNCRKINVKSVVEFRCKIESNAEFEAICSVSSENPMPSKSGDISSFHLVSQSENNFEISDTIPLPQGNDPIKEILKADINIGGREVKSINGKLVAKGEIEIKAIYCDIAGEMRCLNGEIPFTEVLDADNVGENDVVRVAYGITDFKYSASADNDGEKTLFRISACICVCTSVYSSQEECVINDLYSPDFCVTAETAQADLRHLASTGSTRTTVKEVVGISQNAPLIEKIYNIVAKPYIEESKIISGKIHISGVTDVYVTYISADSNQPIYTFKKELPFEINTQCSGNTSLTPDVICTPSTVHWASVSQRDIEIRFFLDFDIYAFENQKISYISDVRMDESKDDDICKKAGIVIYFAQRGEEMWDICKRYSTTEEDISVANGMSFPATLEEDTKILIPKRQPVKPISQ